MIVYKYGKMSPLSMFAFGLLGMAVAIVALPFLAFFFVVVSAMGLYMAWRLKRALDAALREQASNDGLFSQGEYSPGEDISTGPIIDITPEDPVSEKHAKTPPAVLSSK